MKYEKYIVVQNLKDIDYKSGDLNIIHENKEKYYKKGDIIPLLFEDFQSCVGYVEIKNSEIAEKQTITYFDMKEVYDRRSADAIKIYKECKKMRV